MKQKTWFALHRWLFAAVGLQLLAWTAGGFVFATHDLDHVRGRSGQADGALPVLAMASVHVSPRAAVEAVAVPVTGLELRMLDGRPVYELQAASAAHLVDASTGLRITSLDAEAATRIALQSRKGSPRLRSCSLVEEDPDVEYRDKPLPAWRVDLDDADDTHIYVEAATGRIRAVRNNAWRRFDFFWMLHTMDYAGRDDFNTPWLVAASTVLLVAIVSGAALWWLRIRRRWG